MTKTKSEVQQRYEKIFQYRIMDEINRKREEELRAKQLVFEEKLKKSNLIRQKFLSTKKNKQMIEMLT